MSTHTRLATLADVRVLAELFSVFNESTVTPEQIAARLQACQGIETTIVGELDGHIAGFACLRLVPYMSDDRPYAELTDLFVAAAFRRRGLARALIAHVEEMARTSNAAELVIITGFDNHDAQATYRASGYANWALAMKKQF